MVFEKLDAHNKRVRRAIATTPREYLMRVLQQRLQYALTQAGSYFSAALAATPAELLSCLMLSDWVPYPHPAVISGAAFRCELPGQVGVLQLDALESTSSIEIIRVKEQPYGEAAVRERLHHQASFSVAIIGSGTAFGEEDEILWTVHPGDPVAPAPLPLELCGSRITVEEARARGVEWVKILP